MSVVREPNPEDAESGSVGREDNEGISVDSGDDIIAGPAVSLVRQEISLGMELPSSLLIDSILLYGPVVCIGDPSCSSSEAMRRGGSDAVVTGQSLSPSYWHLLIKEHASQ